MQRLPASLLCLLTACGSAATSPMAGDAATTPGDGDAQQDEEALDGSSGDGDAGKPGNADSGQGSTSDAGHDASTKPPSLDDVDLTLGGMNADLAAPLTDCLHFPKLPFVSCVSVSGEYNGVPFTADCPDSVYSGAGSDDVGRYIASCSFREAGVPNTKNNEVLLYVSAALSRPAPKTYEFGQAVDLERDSRVLVKFPLRKFGADSEDPRASQVQHIRGAGEVFDGPGRSAGATSRFIRGTFATTITPTPDCVPDADGFGCDSVRLRAVYYARSVVTVFAR
jgi:hypothetical protein